VQARTVVSGNRVVVRGLSGPPVLTTLTGERVARLEPASLYTADGGLLFASTPATLPDSGSADEDPGELTDSSPSPSPTTEPGGGSRLPPGEVQAYSLRTGQPQWNIDIAPDPLGAPTVEGESGIVVVVGVNGVAHGIDAETGIQEWRAPTELDNPRVAAGGGLVLFDKVEEPQQVLVDARTGLPLPEPEEPIIDLKSVGALQIVDGVARVVSPKELRTAPSSVEETFG
jgi:outer membrane protein assembly factor BamB